MAAISSLKMGPAQVKVLIGGNRGNADIDGANLALALE
jgi:hypothetical protein